MAQTLSKYKIYLNSNKDLVEDIRSKLESNGNYCPSKAKSKDTFCMCEEFKQMEEGSCRCGLYIKALNYDE